jgi:hypothetical protein
MTILKGEGQGPAVEHFPEEVDTGLPIGNAITQSSCRTLIDGERQRQTIIS